MQTTNALKLKIPSETTYIRMPLDFLRLPVFAGLSMPAIFILSMIYTLNRISQKKYNHSAKIRYEDFIARLSMSKETVSTAKQLLIDKGIIEYLGKSRYKILVEFGEKDYIEIDDYLHTQVWEMTPYEPGTRKRQRKEQKKITRRGAIILAFLERMNRNPDVKPVGTFISSQERIGKALHMPRTTAGDNVREIVAASLCDTETAPHGLTKYTVKPELLNVKRIAPKVKKELSKQEETKEPAKPKKPKKLTKREQAEKERRTAAVDYVIRTHYAELRAAAETRATRVLNKALSDNVYKELAERQTSVNIELAKAEARGDVAKVECLTTQALKLDTELNERLKALGIDKRELTPQYKCRTCNDTGYDSGGYQCQCLKKFIENLDI